jgi:hypothetical protein
MKIVMAMALAAGLVAMGGCRGTYSPLNARYVPERAEFGNEAIPVPPPAPPPHVEIVNEDPTAKAGGALPSPETGVPAVTGTWTFVTPETVTRVEHKTAAFSRYSLYTGRPGPTDLPFVVITVSKGMGGEAAGVAAADAAGYKVTGEREYTLNGNNVHEWTGNTAQGAGFSELIVRKTGSGASADVCHAMAIVRSAAERDVALSILASIRWKAGE